MNRSYIQWSSLSEVRSSQGVNEYIWPSTVRKCILEKVQHVTWRTDIVLRQDNFGHEKQLYLNTQ